MQRRGFEKLDFVGRCVPSLGRPGTGLCGGRGLTAWRAEHVRLVIAVLCFFS